jgi:hypothetical protein
MAGFDISGAEPTGSANTILCNIRSKRLVLYGLGSSLTALASPFVFRAYVRPMVPMNEA